MVSNSKSKLTWSTELIISKYASGVVINMHNLGQWSSISHKQSIAHNLSRLRTRVFNIFMSLVIMLHKLCKKLVLLKYLQINEIIFLLIFL